MGNRIVCDTCNDSNAVDLRQERIRTKSTPIKEMRPPIVGLPSLYVMALLLSYYGYEDEVEALLCLLSHGTTRYYKFEQKSLKRVLTAWEPWVCDVIFFGDVNYKADCVYPRED